MSVKKPIGDKNILQRRLVQNPKYEGVGICVDTGLTVNMTKALKENEVLSKPQQGEYFKRMRPVSLANLLSKKLQQAQLDEQLASLSPGDAENLKMAMGEPADVFPLPKAPTKEVLLLDVREREEFEQCHIGSAIHYPAARLSRSMNQFSAEILSFRSKQNSVVVLYDLEEEVVVQRKIGNTFVERGFDNIVILSGGLREFVQEHSSLIVGESPVPIIPKPQAVIQGRRQLSSRSSNAASTLGQSVATSHKPKSLSSSLARRNDQTKSWH